MKASIGVWGVLLACFAILVVCTVSLFTDLFEFGTSGAPAFESAAPTVIYITPAIPMFPLAEAI